MAWFPSSARKTNGGPPPEIAALILQTRQGDRRSAEELIRTYQGRVAKFILSQTGGDSHYEDLCQSVFVKVIVGLPRLRTVDRFEPWLFQIARNVCRDHLRRQTGWRRLFVPFEAGHESIASTTDAGTIADERVNECERAIERLPSAQRALLKEALDETKSYADLAVRSGSSVSAVKSRLHRARANLREILLNGE